MTNEQRQRLLKIRAILDGMIDEFGMTDEATFNAKAVKVNAVAEAIRYWKEDADYLRGALVVDPVDNVPYWAMHDNGPTSGQVHKPSESPTIWTHCHGTSPETARPFVSEGYNPYMTGHYSTENGGIFECLQDNVVHAPSVLPNAWKKHEEGGESGGSTETGGSEENPGTDEIPEWVQPDGSNPFAKGAVVKRNGKIWESTVDNNVWEPGVYGWIEKEA